MKLFVGVDIGSTTAKLLVFSHIPTEYDRNVSGEKILKIALDEIGTSESDIAYLVSTGYGRKSFERADLNIPEIIAHGMGTWHMMPGTRTIIDIGGQDSKVIELSEQGVVERFEMNDKCAAGTGRFFEVLTHRLLGIKMEELSDLMKKSKNACTISYLSQKIPIEDIAAGTGRSIARRILAMGRSAQIQYLEPIVFSGGVANNEAITDIFAELLGKPVTAVKMPQSTAALGAALRAHKEYDKLQSA